MSIEVVHTAPPPPSLGRLFLLWTRIGTQSFGGGAATQFLIHRTFVLRGHWIGDEDFSRMWAMVQIAPGINLFSMTMLIGLRLGGAAGLIVSMLGFAVPSTVITLLMTAAYSWVKDAPVVQAALRGIAPAVAALGSMICWRVAGPVLRAKPGPARIPLWIGVAIIVLSVTAFLAFNVPVFAIYFIAGGMGALILLLLRERPRAQEAG